MPINLLIYYVQHNLNQKVRTWLGCAFLVILLRQDSESLATPEKRTSSVSWPRTKRPKEPKCPPKAVTRVVHSSLSQSLRYRCQERRGTSGRPVDLQGSGHTKGHTRWKAELLLNWPHTRPLVLSFTEPSFLTITEHPSISRPYLI